MLAVGVGACSPNNSPPDGGAGPDGGSIPYAWPQAAATFADATRPSLAVTRAGRVVVTFDRAGQRWAADGADAGAAPVSLGALSGTSAPRMAADPASEDIVHLWGGTWMTWFVDGSPAAARGPLTTDPLNWDFIDLGLTWTGAQPLAVLETNRGNALSRYLLALGPRGGPLAGAAPAAARFDERSSTFTYYNETGSVMDLGGGWALSFATDARALPADAGTGNDAGTGTGTVGAPWFLFQRDPGAPDAGAAWLVVADQGLLPLPGKPEARYDWVQVHDFGGGKAALTWTDVAPGSQVFDIFLALLEVGGDRRPVLGAKSVAISQSSGLTANSDFPVVRRSGDGRYWVAWRERGNYGPRVSLYDASLERVLAVESKREMPVDDTEPIAAEVGPDGALHLVGVIRPGSAVEVRYWRFALPP